MVGIENGHFPEAEDEYADSKTYLPHSLPHLARVLIPDCNSSMYQVGYEPCPEAIALERRGCYCNPIEEIPSQIGVPVVLISSLILLFSLREGHTSSGRALQTCDP